MNIVDTFIEITIKKDEDFLKIKETLTRIGIASTKNKALYQSCHILHKQGRFFIVHFKEMLSLDGKETDFSEEDMGRRNTIAKLLADWGLLTLVDAEMVKLPRATMNQIKIIPFKDKQNWTLVTKYQIGNKNI